jgi:hypothetical protein
MSKRDLKKYLADLSKPQLEEQFIEMYEKFSEVKTYYNFVFNPKEQDLVKDAKFKISNEYYPVKTKRAKLRRSTAQKIIKHFINLGVDSFIIADVMLYNIEIAQTYSAEKYIKYESFFKSMLNSYEQAVSYLIENGILDDFKSRVVAIKEETEHQNWSTKYSFSAIVERFDY